MSVSVSDVAKALDKSFLVTIDVGAERGEETLSMRITAKSDAENLAGALLDVLGVADDIAAERLGQPVNVEVRDGAGERS